MASSPGTSAKSKAKPVTPEKEKSEKRLKAEAKRAKNIRGYFQKGIPENEGEQAVFDCIETLVEKMLDVPYMRFDITRDVW